jgi:hypothetical protein
LAKAFRRFTADSGCNELVLISGPSGGMFSRATILRANILLELENGRLNVGVYHLCRDFRVVCIGLQGHPSQREGQTVQTLENNLFVTFTTGHHFA